MLLYSIPLIKVNHVSCKHNVDIQETENLSADQQFLSIGERLCRRRRRRRCCCRQVRGREPPPPPPITPQAGCESQRAACYAASPIALPLVLLYSTFVIRPVDRDDESFLSSSRPNVNQAQHGLNIYIKQDKVQAREENEREAQAVPSQLAF